MHSHESAMGVHVSPSRTPLLPPQPILQGCPKAPALSAVSQVPPGLAICFTYGDTHVSMICSQIIPCSPSPKESKVWILFLGAPKSLQMIAAMKLKDTYSLGKKVMTKLDSILKSRDIALSKNVPSSQSMVFPVVMYGYESWTVKKTEHQRIDAFELWCWRRLLRIPCIVRGSSQSMLKEISSG